jgi:hypothetical protein
LTRFSVFTVEDVQKPVRKTRSSIPQKSEKTNQYPARLRGRGRAVDIFERRIFPALPDQKTLDPKAPALWFAVRTIIFRFGVCLDIVRGFVWIGGGR